MECPTEQAGQAQSPAEQPWDHRDGWKQKAPEILTQSTVASQVLIVCWKLAANNFCGLNFSFSKRLGVGLFFGVSTTAKFSFMARAVEQLSLHPHRT